MQIQLSNDDIEVLLKFTKDIKAPECYLEIGTWSGGSAFLVMNNVPEDVDIYTIDYDNKYELWETRIKFINDYSINAVKDWKQPIKTLFIDGDHNQAGQDFQLWSPFVVSGGYILFHDYARHSPNVIKNCDEIFSNNPDYKILYTPNDNGETHTSIFQVQKL